MPGILPNQVFEPVRPIIVEPYMIGSHVRRFRTRRLNVRRNDGWAVLEAPSGAIASSADGRLLMRLKRADAERIAAKLTFMLHTFQSHAPGRGASPLRSVELWNRCGCGALSRT